MTTTNEKDLEQRAEIEDLKTALLEANDTIAQMDRDAHANVLARDATERLLRERAEKAEAEVERLLGRVSGAPQRLKSNLAIGDQEWQLALAVFARWNMALLNTPVPAAVVARAATLVIALAESVNGLMIEEQIPAMLARARAMTKELAEKASAAMIAGGCTCSDPDCPAKRHKRPV